MEWMSFHSFQSIMLTPLIQFTAKPMSYFRSLSATLLGSTPAALQNSLRFHLHPSLLGSLSNPDPTPLLESVLP